MLQVRVYLWGIFLSQHADADGYNFVLLLFSTSQDNQQRGVTARVVVTRIALVVAGELSMQGYTKQGFI